MTLWPKYLGKWDAERLDDEKDAKESKMKNGTKEIEQAAFSGWSAKKTRLDKWVSERGKSYRRRRRGMRRRRRG